MAKDETFWTTEAPQDFKLVKHNKTDFDAFKEFTQNLDNRFAPLEKERERKSRQDALRKWVIDLPPRWKDARLRTIEKPVAQKIMDALRETPKGSFFLHGESGAGKTFVSYALIRHFIGTGKATPSTIKMISESILLSWATQGFKGAERFSEVLDNRFELYFLDGIGSLNSQEAEKVSGLWEQLIDHIFNRDAIAVFTSADSFETFVKFLSPSGETKLRTLVSGRTFEVEPKGSIAKKV